jgi:hypothetical protein
MPVFVAAAEETVVLVDIGEDLVPVASVAEQPTLARHRSRLHPLIAIPLRFNFILARA